MKSLFTKRSIFIAAVAVLIAVVTIVSVNIFNSSGPVTGIAGSVSRPLRMLASNVARVFENIYSSIYRYDNLMTEYERALRIITEYERNYREANDLREENDRLRALVEWQKRHSGYRHEQAMIEIRSSDNWSSSFTIDKGYANSNIRKGNGVATEYGLLIGKVADVGPTTSKVITILDTAFSAGAFVGDSDGAATVRGDFSLMRSGLLMLDRIDEDLVVLPGDSVVTSGAGSVFPTGLVVGRVVEVFRHDTGIGRYATVKPMLDIDTMSYVFVITDFQSTEQEEAEYEGAVIE